MDDNNTGLGMRDHIAMSILTSIMSQGPNAISNITAYTGVMRNTWLDVCAGNKDDQFIRLVRFSYHLADIVRKVRLTSFE